MVSLAQEALSRQPEGMTLHEIMDYLEKNGYQVLSDKVLQGSLIAMVKEPAVFSAGLDKHKRKVYKLVKTDHRFVQVADRYHQWRNKQLSGE